jgi:hypothetical protein
MRAVSIGKLRGQVAHLLLDRCRGCNLRILIGRRGFILLLDDLCARPACPLRFAVLQALFLCVFRAEIGQRFLCRVIRAQIRCRIHKIRQPVRHGNVC